MAAKLVLIAKGDSRDPRRQCSQVYSLLWEKDTHSDCREARIYFTDGPVARPDAGSYPPPSLRPSAWKTGEESWFRYFLILLVG